MKTNKIHPNFIHVCKLKPYRERVNEEIAVRTSDETSGADEVHPGTTPDPSASNNYTPMPNSNHSGDSDNLGSRQNQQPAAHEIVETPAHPITSGHKSPPEQPNHPVRRSVIIKDEMSEISKSNSQNEDRPKFYGSVDASGEVQNNPNVIQSTVMPKIGILKKLLKQRVHLRSFRGMRYFESQDAQQMEGLERQKFQF